MEGEEDISKACREACCGVQFSQSSGRSRDPETATVSILVEHLVQGKRGRSGQK